jgi:hypothetical protein
LRKNYAKGVAFKPRITSEKIMKTNYILLSVFSAAIGLCSQNASAQFNSVFPSASSTVIGSDGTIITGEYGYFWSEARGDSITQTFSGTGLSAVDSLSLIFSVPYNTLIGPDLTWNVLINGTKVGGWSISEADGTTVEDLNYSFLPITGSGTYTIAMDVSDEIPSGDGSIAIGDGQMTLNEIATGPTPGVPDSTDTLVLLGAGLLALAGIRCRKQASA